MNRIPNWLTDIGPAMRACLSSAMTDIHTLEAPKPSDWRDEAPLIIGARLAPVAAQLLTHANASADRDVQEAKDLFIPAARMLVLRSMAIEAGARRALSALADSGIPFVVIKGPAVARFHPDAELRPFSDIDIVVPERLFTTAYAIVRAKGYQSATGSQQPWGLVQSILF